MKKKEEVKCKVANILIPYVKDDGMQRFSPWKSIQHTWYNWTITRESKELNAIHKGALNNTNNNCDIKISVGRKIKISALVLPI